MNKQLQSRRPMLYSDAWIAATALRAPDYAQC